MLGSSRLNISPPEVEHPRMRQFDRLTAIALLLLFISASGCSVVRRINPFANKKRATAPKKNYRFDDLPVPSGLSLSEDESFILETPGTRAGQLIYTGGREYKSTVNFFRTRMPNHGWKLISSVERGETSMTFEKPGWLATIFIRKATLGTRVSINLGPMGTKRVDEKIPARPNEDRFPRR